jgi:endonuclease/exonuclease/phosphatase family metal-dependent hydrolase
LKPLSALLFGALLLTPLGAAAEQASEPATLRVLTYNIHHGEGRDGRFDLFRLAEVMRGAQPDLIALQEVDRWTERAGGVDQLAELAALLGMHAEFGRAIDLAGGQYGVAILSRWPMQDVENRPLPASEGYEKRTALTVRVRAGEAGPWIRFSSTHLDNSRDVEEKLAQARRLNELLAVDDDLSLLAGDFNARPGTDVIAILEERWTIALPDVPPASPDGPSPTPPNGAPAGSGAGGPGGPGQQRRGPRGDFVLLRPTDRWRVLESRSLDEQVASDHRPVLTVLEWVENR